MARGDDRPFEPSGWCACHVHPTERDATMLPSVWRTRAAPSRSIHLDSRVDALTWSLLAVGVAPINLVGHLLDQVRRAARSSGAWPGTGSAPRPGVRRFVETAQRIGQLLYSLGNTCHLSLQNYSVIGQIVVTNDDGVGRGFGTPRNSDPASLAGLPHQVEPGGTKRSAGRRRTHQ